MKAAKKLLFWLPALLVCAGLWQLGGGVWLFAKAELAQYLISESWQRQLTSGEPQKPWPWADTWPVARLQLDNDKPLLVLQGTSGQALAFGPGLHEASALPVDEKVSASSGRVPRTTVIAAHRDTHFRGLKNLRPGMTVQLQVQDGRWHYFRVRGTRVADSRSESLPIFDRPGLLLVTCYPFDAIQARGPLRYLVYADPVPLSPTVHL